MKTFSCRCGQTLFFSSVTCIKCGIATGLCPACRKVVSLVAADSDSPCCGNPACGKNLKKCANAQEHQICNGLIDVAAEPAESQCIYCRLTTMIPDLSVVGNRDKWGRLEHAKRRVLYVVDEIDLPYRKADEHDEPILSFEFKADAQQKVNTGHFQGCITINIREADDVEREKSRVAFAEPQRTLVGHFRHELGHFFWDRLVKGQREESFRKLFGDETDPAYAVALQQYYDHGPPGDWSKSHITAYATMHPWEDFAESFGAYLDLVSVLLTANHFQLAALELGDFDAMIVAYQQIGIIANEFNRDMGLLDLVPEVFVPPVIEKLRYIHHLRRCREVNRLGRSSSAASISLP